MFDQMDSSTFKSKGSVIASHILRKIRSGEFKVGDKLPSERLLAEMAGVSRPSVREAICALQIVDIVESRIGAGNYVIKDLKIDDFAFQVKNILEESDSPYEIIQARKVIETGSVRLAIKEATNDDLRMIEAAWEEKHKFGLAGDYKVYLRLGKELHLAIAKATKNRIIISVVDRLLNISGQPLYQNMRKLYYESDPSRIEHMSTIHDRLVSAIRRRDTVEAMLALEADFDTVTEQLYSFSGNE